MLKEHLDAIRSKEKEARERVREAEARAEMIRQKVREEGGVLLDETRAQAADFERSLVAKARREAEERIAEMRAENAKAIVALSVGAKKSMEKALEAVLRAFRGGA